MVLTYAELEVTLLIDRCMCECRSFLTHMCYRGRAGNWKTLLPHSQDRLIQDFTVFKDFVAVEGREVSVTCTLPYFTDSSNGRRTMLKEALYNEIQQQNDRLRKAHLLMVA